MSECKKCGAAGFHPCTCRQSASLEDRNPLPHPATAYELIGMAMASGYSLEMEGPYNTSEHTHFHCNSLAFVPQRPATIHLCHTWEDENEVVHTEKGLLFHKEKGIDRSHFLATLMSQLIAEDEK